MKKKKIDSRLIKYSAAAGATVLGASAAQGEIIHTDIDPVVLSQGGTTSYNIDVGSDTKFSIFQQRVYSTSSSVWWSSAAIVAQTAAAFWEGNGNNTASVFALGTGVQVNTQSTGWGQLFSGDSNWNLASYSTGGSTGGNFINTADKYIGIKFDIGADTHYGWIQLEINEFASVVTINEWAYNDVAGEGIETGAIPEPSSLALLALGAAGIRLFRKRYSQV